MKILSAIADFIFPPRCAFCDRLIKSSETEICEKCEKSLPYTKGSAVNQKKTFIDSCVSPLYYEGAVKESLHRYKFSQCPGNYRAYAKLMSGCIGENLSGQFDIITWVPLSRRRLRERGYDQARLLAEAIGKSFKVPVVPALVKAKHTAPQSKTGSAEKRRANISGAYILPKPETVLGKRILLIDDIVTTGATLSECARMLGMAGAEKIFAATVARSRD